MTSTAPEMVDVYVITGVPRLQRQRGDLAGTAEPRDDLAKFFSPSDAAAHIDRYAQHWVKLAVEHRRERLDAQHQAHRPGP